MIGMINRGCTSNENVTSEELKTMAKHDTKGTNIIVFSLVVHHAYRKQGISRLLTENFMKKVKLMGKKKIYWLCRKELIHDYKKLNAVLDFKSQFSHGGLSSTRCIILFIEAYFPIIYKSNFLLIHNYENLYYRRLQRSRQEYDCCRSRK
jgi:predicted GNAT family acetyltransferase